MEQLRHDSAVCFLGNCWFLCSDFLGNNEAVAHHWPQGVESSQWRVNAVVARRWRVTSVPGFRLHPLKGADKGRWSVWLNGNWRLTFEFRDGQAYVLDYEDYH
jgi:hypothetical protein